MADNTENEDGKRKDFVEGELPDEEAGNASGGWLSEFGPPPDPVEEKPLIPLK